MKYESNTKSERNREVTDLRKNHPELSLEEIGKRFGISRQAVWVICSKQFPWRK